MYIWLITVGEPLPTDNNGRNRLLRIGILANLLIEQGHQIIWWTSTFDHTLKKQRFDTDTSIDINSNLCLNLLHSVAYKNNISFARILNHYGIARKFTHLSAFQPRPDIILCSLPPLELCLAATQYGKRQHCPVILDVRDLWPDIFLELVPRWAQSSARLLLSPMFQTLQRTCKQATAIIGITPKIVNWGVQYAERELTPLDRDFPLAYAAKTPSSEAIAKGYDFWQQFQLNSNQFIICFFGTLGRQFDLETVLAAAQILNFSDTPFQFVICGTGDRLTFYQELAKDCKNVIFPGWVGAGEIWTLMQMSRVGLAPYLSSFSFTMSIPNKAIEYLSAGLPVVSSLKGTLEELLDIHRCGVTYENGNSHHLVSILKDLYNHPDHCKAMSTNASSLYQTKFMAETVYSDLIDYLESVCSNKQATD